MTAQLVVDSPGVHEALFGELLAELTLVGVAVPSRAPVPALTGVLLEARDGVLTASATDFDVTLRTVLPGRYDGPDAVVLVKHTDLVKQLSAMGSSVKDTKKRAALPVRLDLDALTIETNGYTMPLEPLEVNDNAVEHVRKDAPPNVAHVDFGEVTALANRVGVALGKDDTLPMLTGMHLVITDGRLTFEATDRFHLTIGSMGAITTAGGEELVPGKQLLDGLKALGKAGVAGQIALGLDHETLTLTAGCRTLSIRTLYGSTFPKTKQLLPEKVPGSVVLDRAEAVASVATVKALIAAKDSAGTNSVNLVVDGAGVRWVPVIDNPDRRAAVKTPAATATVVGTPKSLSQFNVDLVVKALASFAGDQVVVHVQDGFKAVVFTDELPGLTDALAFKYLVMPMRIQDPPEAKPAEKADAAPAAPAP